MSTSLSDFWILVTGGLDSSENPISTTELFSVNNTADPVPQCRRTLANFPQPVVGAAAITIDSGLFVCGGERNYTKGETQLPKLCFAYNGAEKWNPAGNMSYSRFEMKLFLSTRS